MKIIVAFGPAAGRVVDVDRELVIGRVAPADIVIDDPLVSRRHARLRPRGGALEIADLGSDTGTFVRGERLTGPCDLLPGDEVRLGQTTLRVDDCPATGAMQVPTHWTLSVRTGPDMGDERVVDDGAVLIGREETADLRLTDPGVSAHHVRFAVRGQVATVTDLESANGTLVDGLPVGDEVAIRSGAEIQVGETVIVATRGDVLAAGPAPTVTHGAIAVEPLPVRSAVGRVRVLAGVVAFGAVVAVASVALNRGDESLTSTQIVTKNRASMVMILGTVDGAPTSVGAGFVIDSAQGLILTTHRVATGDLSIQPEADRALRAPGTIVAANPCEDLALVSVDAPAVRAAVRAVRFSGRPSAPGDPVVALGYPESSRDAPADGRSAVSAASGVVEAPDTRYDVPQSALPLLTSVIEHTATLDRANAGGPLFDDQGELIGVTIAPSSDGRTPTAVQGYAVSERRITEQLRLLTAGTAPHWLGVSLGATLRDGTGDPTGVAIAGVTPGSPAARAGIRPGATLVAVDGRTVFDGPSYCTAVPAGEGAQVTLTMQDPGTRRQDDVALTVGNG